MNKIHGRLNFLILSQTMLANAMALPDGSSSLKLVRTLLSNPVDAWYSAAYLEPYYKVRFLGRDLIYVSDPDVIQAILLTHEDSFPKGPVEMRMLRSVTGRGLFTTEGQEWRRQRRAASSAFRQNSLDAMIPVMNDAAQRSVMRLSNGPNIVDVHQEMIAATFQIIHSTMLSGGEGIINEERAARAIETILETVGKPDPLDLMGAPPGMPRPWGRKARKAIRQIRDDAQLVIDHRKKKSELGDDLLGLMLAAKDSKTGKPLSNIQVRDNLLTFIAAGHETTALALTWSLYLLGHHPDWQIALRDEVLNVCGDRRITADDLKRLTLIEQVINEAMRLYPPAPAIDRIAKTDLNLHGLDIKKGDFIVIGIMPLHRHEKLWNNPNDFDPTRFEREKIKSKHKFSFIPFSGGPRVCIGLRFAMMEATIILANLVREFNFSPAHDNPVRLISRITLRPEGGMPMEIGSH